MGYSRSTQSAFIDATALQAHIASAAVSSDETELLLLLLLLRASPCNLVDLR